MSILDATFFRDEEAAYAKLEAVLWPRGPECPKCGAVNDAHKIATNTAKKVRHGLYRCNACKTQFTVTVGTVFESSHIPLHKWLQAAYLLNSSKKGISAKQIERTLQITYKSAWFMMHRLRTAMDPIFNKRPTPMGGKGKFVEADETFIGRKKGDKVRAGFDHKMAVLSLVERAGKVRSFHIDRADKTTVTRILHANVRKDTHFRTDSATHYRATDFGFTSHELVDHSKGEYVRGDAYTNTLEGFFSIFKRGMKGIYQHCSEKHLVAYLAEFDFRYNNREALGVNDSVRMNAALRGARGKRLSYRPLATD